MTLQTATELSFELIEETTVRKRSFFQTVAKISRATKRGKMTMTSHVSPSQTMPGPDAILLWFKFGHL